MVALSVSYSSFSANIPLFGDISLSVPLSKYWNFVEAFESFFMGKFYNTFTFVLVNLSNITYLFLLSKRSRTLSVNIVIDFSEM